MIIIERLTAAKLKQTNNTELDWWLDIQPNHLMELCNIFLITKCESKSNWSWLAMIDK